MVIRRTSSNHANRAWGKNLAKEYLKAGTQGNRDLQTKINKLVNGQPEDFRNSSCKPFSLYENRAGLTLGVKNAYGPVQVRGPIIAGDGKRAFVA
jgi:hypothetical protein